MPHESWDQLVSVSRFMQNDVLLRVKSDSSARISQGYPLVMTDSVLWKRGRRHGFSFPIKDGGFP